jgi:hypothetical protein
MPLLKRRAAVPSQQPTPRTIEITTRDVFSTREGLVMSLGNYFFLAFPQGLKSSLAKHINATLIVLIIQPTEVVRWNPMVGPKLLNAKHFPAFKRRQTELGVPVLVAAW